MDDWENRCMDVVESVKTLVAEGRLEDAMLNVKLALTVVPQEGQSHTHRVLRVQLQLFRALLFVADRMEDYAEVATVSSAILETCPQDVCAAFYHAKALMELKDYTNAVVEFRAILMDPRHKGTPTFKLIPGYLRRCTGEMEKAASARKHVTSGPSEGVKAEPKKKANKDSTETESKAPSMVWQFGIGGCVVAGAALIGYGLYRLFK